MNSYEFHVDEDGRAFCDEVVSKMEEMFGISNGEALGRVNRQWKGVDFVFQDLRYHEPSEFWASDIFFGPASEWWKHPDGRVPVPFP